MKSFLMTCKKGNDDLEFSPSGSGGRLFRDFVAMAFALILLMMPSVLNANTSIINHQKVIETVDRSIPVSSDGTRLELVFIDDSLPDYHLLLETLQNQPSLSKKNKIFVLDSEKDSFSQITDILSFYSGINAVHLFSHGAEGRLIIGGKEINRESLTSESFLRQLQGWKKYLNKNADILLYG